MKKIRLLLPFLIIFYSAHANAQNKLLMPKLLIVDTSLGAAGSFNNLVLRYAPGFRLLDVDKQQSGNVVYTYVNGDEFLHLSYKYQEADGSKTVDFQSVRADLSIIMPIVNGLFGMNLPSDIEHTTDVAGTISYHGKNYQCFLQADDRVEGYWELSFVR